MKRLARNISIIRPNSISLASPLDLGTASSTAEKIPLLEGEGPQFQVLNNIPSVLSLHLDPSVPVHVKKGSLISVYRSGGKLNSDSLLSHLEIRSPLKRFLYGRFTSTYQRVVSTSPCDALVSANIHSKGKVFANLQLDGRIDWAVFPAKALQCYSGSSLLISNHMIPRKVAKKVSKLLNLSKNHPTGLFSWWKPGYTLLSGRGLVSLVGNSGVYRINLAKEEQLLIEKDHILALTVNGPTELSSACVAESLGNPQTFLERIFHYASRNNFVKVRGPRTVLLQTGRDLSSSKVFSPAETEGDAKEASLLEKPKRTSADYLKVATVKDGKVEFKSTSNFNEEIERIRKR